MTIRLMKGSEPSFMTATAAARRSGYAAMAELALREALEALCRERWPGARVVHELVMGEGKVRADVVAIDTAHIVAFEIKASYDNTVRLLHQVGMYQLCVPEVWMLVDQRHADDAKLIRHLLPCVGLIAAPDLRRTRPEAVTLEIVAEPDPRPVVPEMLLRLLWAQELRICCDEVGSPVTTKATRAVMVNRLLSHLDVSTLIEVACRRLRARDALWRADAPVRDEGRARLHTLNPLKEETHGNQEQAG